MSPLRSSEQELIRAAIAANVEPKASDRGRTLRLEVAPGSFKTLLGINGKPTPAGTFYYKEKDQPPPAFGYDPNQRIIQDGPRDFIKLLNGKRALVRTIQPSTDDYKLIKIGKDFFKDNFAQYDITIPIWVGIQTMWLSMDQRHRDVGQWH